MHLYYDQLQNMQCSFEYFEQCILYGSLFYFEVPDGKKFRHLNEKFYWHFNNLTAYVHFMPHFQ